ncbi:MAG: AbiV family abortive infection protein [Pirellulales bacterium]
MSSSSEQVDIENVPALMLALSRKALENAQEIVKDAELLFANGRWARTIFLSQIAGEEIGKHLIARGAYVQNLWEPRSIDWNKIVKEIRRHQDKLITMTIFEDMLLTEPPMDIAAIKSQAKELDQAKQTTLYAEFIGAEARSPTELWTDASAANALKWAQGRVQLAVSIVAQTRPLDEMSREHLIAVAEKFPEWKKAMERVKKASE